MNHGEQFISNKAKPHWMCLSFGNHECIKYETEGIRMDSGPKAWGRVLAILWIRSF